MQVHVDPAERWDRATLEQWQLARLRQDSAHYEPLWERVDWRVVALRTSPALSKLHFTRQLNDTGAIGPETDAVRTIHDGAARLKQAMKPHLQHHAAVEILPPGLLARSVYQARHIVEE